MTTDTKFLKQILANQIQKLKKNTKKNNTSQPSEAYPRNARLVQHIKKICIITSIDAQNTFDKIQHLRRKLSAN